MHHTHQDPPAKIAAHVHGTEIQLLHLPAIRTEIRREEYQDGFGTRAGGQCVLLKIPGHGQGFGRGRQRAQGENPEQ
jgi:hypothetical protein